MSEIFPGAIRDKQIDWKLKRVSVLPNDLPWYISGVGIASTSFGTPTLAYSVGSPTMVTIPTGGSTAMPMRGVQLTQLGAVMSMDFAWRVPHDFDNRHPLYVRHNWSTLTTTATAAVGWRTLWGPVSLGDGFTAATNNLSVVHTMSSKTTTAAWTLVVSPYGSIQPLATGPSANQTFAQNLEWLKFNVSVVTVNALTIATDTVVWLGADLAYTPHATFGDGSQREGRKIEPALNLGDQEVGAAGNF